MVQTESSPTVVRVEPLLRMAIDYARQQGYTLVRGVTVEEKDKTCCAYGACMIAGGHKDNFVVLGALGVCLGWAKDLMDGFDGQDTPTFHNQDAFELGQKLAQEYIERKES